MSSVGAGADPGSHKPDDRLQLLSARPTVDFPAVENHRSLAGNKLQCLATEEYPREQHNTCPAESFT